MLCSVHCWILCQMYFCKLYVQCLGAYFCNVLMNVLFSVPPDVLHIRLLYALFSVAACYWVIHVVVEHCTLRFFFSECHGLADILLFYDVPETDEDLAILRSYMETIVRYQEIAENATRVALTAVRDGHISPVSTLEQNFNQSEILQVLLHMRTERTTGHFLPNSTIKWRDDVIKIVVLFRLGLNDSTWRKLSRFVTTSYRQDVLRFVINIGDGSVDIVNQLASEPKASHVIYAPYLDTLMTTAPYLLHRICDGKMTTAIHSQLAFNETLSCSRM